MNKISKILAAVDLSPESRRVLDYAFTFGRLLDADIMVLHVVDGRTLQPLPYAYDEVKEETLGKMSQEEMVEEIKRVVEEEIRQGASFDHKLRVTTLIRYGIPYDQIIKAAGEVKADFVVLGAEGHTALAEFFIGHTAEKVSRRAPCPVFIVRALRQGK